jgi:hypothetical protein
MSRVSETVRGASYRVPSRLAENGKQEGGADKAVATGHGKPGQDGPFLPLEADEGFFPPPRTDCELQSGPGGRR